MTIEGKKRLALLAHCRLWTKHAKLYKETKNVKHRILFKYHHDCSSDVIDFNRPLTPMEKKMNYKEAKKTYL